MTTSEQPPVARDERFRDELIQPFLAFGAIAGTVVQLSDNEILFPAMALPLFGLVSASAIATLLPTTWLGHRGQIAAIAAYMLLGALLLPLAHETTTAALFPYAAAAAAGAKLASRKAAVGIAVTGAVVAAGGMWLVGLLAPGASEWPWWVPLTVCLPVYVGISHQDRFDALLSARRAAEQARRARESEAREAALIERARIAREIHDVLGHSLSGIALQLDMADALHGSGRDEEANAAVRRARAVAVDSIGETRRAVHALRADILPLPDTLQQLAEHASVDFTITGQAWPVGAEATHAVIRAAQEALTNAAKHAPGAKRTMSLAFTADRITLTVQNSPAIQGRSSHADGAGVGLVGMRERAALLGGTLQAEPTPDGGWIVVLELPR
jgi:signal transduction histidine kinase